MNIAVIFAGGVGSRMRSKEKPKQFLELHGKPIIIQTVEVFENHPGIDAIEVVCLESWIPHMKMLIGKYGIKKVKAVVPGGVTGQQSIYNGLCAAKETAGDEQSIVLIHDGVRPLISACTITDNINSVREHGSAVTSVMVKETVLLVGENEQIRSIPHRSCCRLARAPQSFWLHDILSAHRRAISEGRTDFIDSCSMMEEYGYKIHLVIGSDDNLKVTTPEDFYIMRAILDARENAQIYGIGETKGE